MLSPARAVLLGGVPAAQLAERFGTPLYVIDAEAIQRRFETLTTAIEYRPLRVHYACKANANVAVMRHLRSLGAGLDACSPGDLAFADAAGFATDDIVYTGCAIGDEEMEFLAARELLINADSLSQVERYGALRPGSKIGLRVNSGVVAGFHAHVRSGGRNSKFGIHPGQIPEALRIAGAYGLQVVGLHTHLGSDLFSVAEPLLALDRLIQWSEQLPSLEYIDVGGGWGVPFAPGDTEFDMERYGFEATARMRALSRSRDKPMVLRIEPGAYLLSDAGSLLMRVTELKHPVRVDDQGTPFFAGTDSSYNHVFSAAMYDSYHHLLVADRGDDAATTSYDVVGNLMQAGDVLARDRRLPNLRVGDVLVMKNCGAYSACRATTFNGRPRPAEVLVSDGDARLVRRRETVEDLLGHQVVEGD